MRESESRFASYVEHIASTLGHADRRTRFAAYCAGLILPGDRKSVEPIAARIEPSRVQGAHQSLHHFVRQRRLVAGGSAAAGSSLVLLPIEKSGKISAWIVDDTGFPQEGRSFGGGRPAILRSAWQAGQLSGRGLAVGRQRACKPADRLSALSSRGLGGRPGSPGRAGVPRDVVFKTKPQIALDQIRAARAEGVPEGVVLADAGYGINTAFRTALTRMGLTYVVGIQSSRSFGRQDPVRSRPRHGAGKVTADPDAARQAEQAQSAGQLAKSLSADAWRDVAWREGVDKTLHSRFASLRVRPAHRDYWRSQPYPEEWLLVEWPQGESAPTKYWLSTLPADADLETLVATAKMRWRIERDYQELKQELGLGHYEGRGWRGFHHHMALCVAAYGFWSPDGV